MAALHFTTIPCEPDTATDIFCELRPFTNNIYNSAGFEIFRTFPGALMSVFKSFAREELG